MMFKSNPNFNEYYGLIYQINRKQNKLKRTQSSKEKIEHSKKSFSQGSHSDGQTSIHKRNKHLQDFMTRRNNDHQNKTNENVNSPQSLKEENILDLFKRKDISQKINIRKSVDLYPDIRSKKYVGINYNQISSKKLNPVHPAQKYQLAQYFGDSFDIKNKRSDPNSSKSRSLRNRSQKSPLRMLKSKSRQQLYTPVQKMLNIIKQEQKVRQQKIYNQKTIKHINYIRTLNELNETHMNYPALKHVRSEKNLYEMEPQSHKKKKKRNGIHNYETSNSKNVHHSKNEFSRKKIHSRGLKNSESEIVFQTNRNHENKKLSSSKIKKYFNRKEQVQKDNMKMRNILESVGTKKQIVQLRKIQSQRNLLYSNLQSNNSEVSQSMMSQNRSSSKHQMQSQQRISLKSGQQDSRYQNGSVYEYSEYGLEVQESHYQQKIENKKFYKTPKKNSESYEQYKSYDLDVPRSPAGIMIDQIQSFYNSKFKEFINESQMDHNEVNSIASIQQQLPYQRQQYKKDTYISEKGSNVSIKSSECQIIVHTPSKAQFQAQISINTPAYRHNLTEKKPKQSIITKLKKDIAEDKSKSGKNLKLGESKLSKKQSQVSKKNKNLASSSSYLSSEQQLKKQTSKNHRESNYSESQNNIKIESKNVSEIEGLSNLIHSKQEYQMPNPPPQLKHKNTWKESGSKLKSSNLKNEQKSKKQHTIQINGQDLTELESVSSERKSSRRTYKIDSMINSNKMSQAKSHESESMKSQSQLSSSKKSSSIKNSKSSEKQVQQTMKPHQEKKPIRFLKIIKKDPLPVIPIPKIYESNIESLTDSYQTQSIASSQTIHLISSAAISHSIKFPNSIQKIHIDQSNSKIIRQEQGSQSKSSQSQSSIDMSSSSSVYLESVKKSQEIKKKISDSEYSESSQSQAPTSKKIKSSRMSQSEQNLKTNSQFSLSISSQNPSNSVSKSSSVSSASKKFANANKFNKISKNDSNMFKKKKNFAEYTLNDVARYIEQHEFRIEAYCFYIDNSKSAYEEDYELQKIQLLSFLMLKKNLYQLNRAISALQGKGENVFTLTDIEILDEVLQDYRDREEINQQLKNMIKQQKENMKELKQTYESLEKRYNGEKGFNLSLDKDDFSSQIVKKLGQQLNMLYEKWQKNKSDGDRVTARKICEKLQKRMIQIIQLIFLTSEIDGKKVKPFEMLENQIQFLSYYEKWYQRIIQTIEYFDSNSKYFN